MLPFGLDIKTFVAIASIVVGTCAFLPYLFEIFKQRTHPHLYTWLIWFLTQGTATAAIIVGGGGLIGKGMILGTALVFLVFLLSFKYGSKNITRSDVVVLIFALLAIIVWWQLHNPVLAVFMVSAIDALGYIPTYRKLWTEPWSESLSTWVAFTISYVLALIALTELNLLTVPYLVMCVVANIALLAISLARRRLIPRPTSP